MILISVIRPEEMCWMNVMELKKTANNSFTLGDKELKIKNNKITVVWKRLFSDN